MGQKVDDPTHVSFGWVNLSLQLALVHKQFGDLPMVTVPLSNITVGQIAMFDGKRVSRINTVVYYCCEEVLAVWMGTCCNQILSSNGDATHGLCSTGIRRYYIGEYTLV